MQIASTPACTYDTLFIKQCVYQDVSSAQNLKCNQNENKKDCELLLTNYVWVAKLHNVT